MWLIYNYWLFIAVMFVVILLFVLRYSGTNRMTLEAAVELLRTGGPLVVTVAGVSLPGIIAVFNDAIMIHYAKQKKTDGLHEWIRYTPALSTKYLGGQSIWYTDGLVTCLQQVRCAMRAREDISYGEKVQCGKIMRLVRDAIDRSAKQK